VTTHSSEGEYTVTITSAAGSITSPPAKLELRYPLRLNPTPGGLVELDPAQPDYAYGSQVSVTATPAAFKCCAYNSPSSRNGSYSAVSTSVGGRLFKLSARMGEA